MGSMKKKPQLTPNFFEDKPLFGLDIGRSTVRVLQLHSDKKSSKMVGYGAIDYDPTAVQEGVIVAPEKIATAVQKLFKHNLVGDITTRRVAISVPIARTFTRSIDMPKLSEKELAEAVKTEVEQYIPAAAEDLYVDFTKFEISKNKTTVFIVAIPRKIVDSYITLARLLGLELVLIQTSSGAGANLFTRDPQSDLPTLLVDFGSESADITLVDTSPMVSGTVACGGEQITKLISNALNVSEREAMIIKTRYGLGYSKKQHQIEDALNPTLGQLTREIRRTIRYYEERTKAKRTISQVVIMGGGANMPGLADYMTNELRIPTRAFDPTAYIDFGRLQPFNISDRMSYVTAAGHLC
jgi:type IV pilus assembly protein PilM